MNQMRIAASILSTMDDGKRRREILVLVGVMTLTFAAHGWANRWESPLALIPRTFTGIVLGYQLLYVQSLWKVPLVKKYFNISELEKDAQQGPPGYDSVAPAG